MKKKIKSELRDVYDFFSENLFLSKHQLDWFRKRKSILNKKVNSEFCISLTSYPARKRYLILTLQSLLMQDFPERIQITVTLYKEDIDFFEDTKRRFEKYGVDFLISERDIRSYKKYWPSQVSKYKNCVFIIADDDIAYVRNWVSSLVGLHNHSPQEVCGVRGNIIPADDDVRKEYLNWNPIRKSVTGANVLLTSGHGMIIPRFALSNFFYMEEDFMTLAPTADDLYLWSFLVLRGYYFKCDPLKESKCWPYSQARGSLWEINNSGGGNNLAIKLLFQEYPSLANRISAS